MTDAFIYDHLRSPRGRGKVDGSLHEVQTVNLASQVLKGLRERNNLDPELVDDVVMGCVDPIGEAGGDVARISALLAGYGDNVPGIQINRFCASGLDAVNFAAAEVMSGQHDMTIGGGVESMSRVGIGASGGAWFMDPMAAIPTYFMPQGISADLIATKYGFSRDDVDAYAVESQKRAAEAWADGRFKNSILPIKDVNGITLLDRDEHMRPTTTMQSLASLKPAFVEMGQLGGFDAVATQRYPEVEEINHVHHAGNSSGIVDGAAAVLIGNAEAGKAAGLKPRARIKAFANIGSEPGIMLTGPIPVTQKVLKKAGMSTADIDLWELNEAFASVVLRYMQALDIPHDKINVNGGAIAHGPSARCHRRDDPRHRARRTGAARQIHGADHAYASVPAWAPRPSSSGCERANAEDRFVRMRGAHHHDLSGGIREIDRGPDQDRARQCSGTDAVRREPDTAEARCGVGARHWHETEDEFVYIVEGEATLCEDGGETVLRAGECAGFKAGVANGHCLVNKSQADVVYLEIGTRAPADRFHYSDVDMMGDKSESGVRFMRKNGEAIG